MSFDRIVPLARALLSALVAGGGDHAGFTGTRSSGPVRVKNTTGAAIALPPNTYLVPLIQGLGSAQIDPNQLYKVGFNSATAGPHKTGGAWTIPTGGSGLAVTIVSAIGGLRQNLPTGTTLRFDPAVAGLEPTVLVESPGLAGGLDPTAPGGLLSAAFYENLGPSQYQDIFAAGLSRFPALLLTWLGSDPAEPAVAGLAQGSTRVARGRRIFRETLVGSVIGSNVESDARRRAEGLETMAWLTDLWSDRMRNDDGEALSMAGGGVEVTSRRRQIKDPRYYIYDLALAANIVVTRSDSRTFNDWTKTRIVEQTETQAGQKLKIPDITEPMP